MNRFARVAHPGPLEVRLYSTVLTGTRPEAIPCDCPFGRSLSDGGLRTPLGPRRDQEALLTAIDAFLKRAGAGEGENGIGALISKRGTRLPNLLTVKVRIKF